jgi:type II secretory pathway component PulJ
MSVMRSLGSDVAATSNERGFTLVELLVVIAAGMVIFVALLAVLDIAIKQTTRVVSQVSSTQEGRGAMNQIENQLQSTCTGGATEGIQQQSTDNQLIFYSGYGGAATVASEQHVVTYNPGSPYGTLTEDNYDSGGALTSTDTLLGRAAPRLDSNGSPLPIFQYFGYEDAKDGTNGLYHDAAGNTYKILLDGNQTLPAGAMDSGGGAAGGQVPANAPAPYAVPLDPSDAGNTAEVEINVIAYPSRGNDVNPDQTNGAAGVVNSAANSITDDISLRLSPVGNTASSGDTSPCA